MVKIKGMTSKRLKEELPHLMHLSSLWTRSYFVSTAGNVSSEIIKEYVESQKQEGEVNGASYHSQNQVASNERADSTARKK